MKDDRHFLLPADPWREPSADDCSVIGLPPDATVPLPTWVGLSATSRTAHYVAEILVAAAEIHAMLASDAAAHLRWIEPELARVSDDARRVLERLAC